MAFFSCLLCLSCVCGIRFLTLWNSKQIQVAHLRLEIVELTTECIRLRHQVNIAMSKPVKPVSNGHSSVIKH